MSGLPFGLLIILFRFVWSHFLSFINHRNNFRKPQTSHIRLNISNGAVHEPWKYPDKHMLKTFLQSPPQHNEPRWPDHPCSCVLRAHAPIYQGPSILNTACRPLLKNEVTPEPRWADRLQNKICLGADVGGIETNNHNGNRKWELGQPNCTVAEKAKLSHVV